MGTLWRSLPLLSPPLPFSSFLSPTLPSRPLSGGNNFNNFPGFGFICKPAWGNATVFPHNIWGTAFSVDYSTGLAYKPDTFIRGFTVVHPLTTDRFHGGPSLTTDSIVDLCPSQSLHWWNLQCWMIIIWHADRFWLHNVYERKTHGLIVSKMPVPGPSTTAGAAGVVWW